MSNNTIVAPDVVSRPADPLVFPVPAPALDHWLSLTAAGYHLFPVWGIDPATLACQCEKGKTCPDAGKHPILKTDWEGKATTDPARVTNWYTSYPGCNFGIAPGKSGYVVVDIDGSKGRSTIAGHPALDSDLTVSTGRKDGGEHRYFRHPGFPVRNVQGKADLPGVDLRADGGYVLAPGSLHRSGKRYQGDLLNPAKAADLPGWFLSLLAPRRADGSAAPATADVDTMRSLLGGLGIGFTERRRDYAYVFVLDRCPVQPEDDPHGDDQSACLYLYADGSVHFACHHNRCQPRRGIQAFYRALGLEGNYFESVNTLVNAPLDDVGNGRRLADRVQGRAYWVPENRGWALHSPEDNRYRFDDDLAIMREAKRVGPAMLRAAADLGDSHPRYAGLIRGAGALGSLKAIDQMIRAAQSEPGLSKGIGLFDQDDPEAVFLPTRNGTIHLASGGPVFLPPSPDRFNTGTIATDYDPTATAPRWLRFVREVTLDDAELAGALQRALGYSIGPSMAEQKFFTLFGKGSNGKGILTNTIRGILGGYGSATPFDTFLKRNQSTINDDLARLRGKRFVIASESVASRRLDEARIKAVTGGDPIVGREQWQRLFEYYPVFKVWLTTNHRPKISDQGHGMWRRVVLFPLDARFGDDSDTDRTHPIDLSLEWTLQAEWPGILQWLIEGYYGWRQHGLALPLSVLNAVNSYRAESDDLGQWLDEHCVQGDTYRMGATLAYQDFQQYLAGIGTRPEDVPTRTVFFNDLEDKGFHRRKMTAGYVFQGICLKQDQPRADRSKADPLA